MARRRLRVTAQEIQDAALAGNLSEYLFVDVFGSEGDINAGDILVDQGLHPALGLGAIEGVTEVAGKGVTEIPQVGNQLFQRGFIFWARSSAQVESLPKKTLFSCQRAKGGRENARPLPGCAEKRGREWSRAECR